MTSCLREKSRRCSDEVFTNGLTNGKPVTLNRGKSETSAASPVSYHSRLPNHCNSPQNGSIQSKASNSDGDEAVELDCKREPSVF